MATQVSQSPRAWPRGTPWTRWRWSARPRRGTRCPGGTAPRCRWTPPPARGPASRSRRHGVGAALHHRGQVLRRGPAATPDRRDAEFRDEPVQVLGQALGREVVVHLAVDHRGEPRVGDAGDRDAAGPREVPQRLAHLDRTGGAVEADDVDLHGVEDGERGADLGARQHASGQLDRHLGLERHVAVQRHHGAPGAVDGGLDREHVELRLDQQEVDAALEQAERLLLVGVAERRRRGSARRWGTWCPVPWSRRPSEGARASRTRRAPCTPARRPGGSARGPGRPARTRPGRPRSSRRCRSRPRRSRPRRRSDGPGPPGPAGCRPAPRCSPRGRGRRSPPRQAEQLQVRAHGAVEDDHALAQCGEVGGGGRIEPSEKFGERSTTALQDTGRFADPKRRR